MHSTSEIESLRDGESSKNQDCSQDAPTRVAWDGKVLAGWLGEKAGPTSWIRRYLVGDFSYESSVRSASRTASALSDRKK